MCDLSSLAHLLFDYFLLKIKKSVDLVMRIIKELFLNFRTFRSASWLNIAGLAVAFTAFMVIVIQVEFERGYDKFYKNADHLFRIETLYPVALQYCAVSPLPVAELIKQQCPEVDDFFVYKQLGELVISVEDGAKGINKFRIGGAQAGVGIIDALGLKILDGDGKKALTSPGMIMIPESLARKWFGDIVVTGKQVKMEGNDKEEYTVGAVYQDLPRNTIFKNDCLFPIFDISNWQEGWGAQVFVLAKNCDANRLQESVNRAKFEPLEQIFVGLNKEEQRKKEAKSYLRVSPLTGVYYDSSVVYDPVDKGSEKNTWIMLGIGLLVILIALINFINFSLALAPSRMRVINIRKVLGAENWELRRQFIFEAVVYVGIAFLVSVGLLQLFAQTVLAEFFTVSLEVKEQLPQIVCIGLGAIGAGIIAGYYPAMYVTSYEPAMVLKANFATMPSGIWVRKILTVFQFVISISLIVCALLMGEQNKFVRNYSPGFETAAIGYVPLDWGFAKNPQAIMAEMRKLPGVIDFTFSEIVPGADMISGQGVMIEGELIQLNYWPVYHNFLRFFDIHLVQGDSLSESNQNNVQILLNETAVKQFPKLKNYFGKTIPDLPNGNVFVGITNDINYLSLRKPIEPLAMIYNPMGGTAKVMFVKLSPTGQAQSIGRIREVFERLVPGTIFEFCFLDEEMQKNYEYEQKQAGIISSLGGLAIILALVGVYGMVVFNAQCRKREIAIRKVNGATGYGMMLLLNKDFLRLLLIAFLVACPLAWYAIGRWLEGFAYRTEARWWMFLLAGLFTLLVVSLTVSWQTWRAATANPVDSLKSE